MRRCFWLVHHPVKGVISFLFHFFIWFWPTTVLCQLFNDNNNCYYLYFLE